MIKLFRSSAALASLALVLVVGAVSPARAGSIGTIADKTIDPLHDLYADLTMGAVKDSFTGGNFDFEGLTVPSGDTFTLTGTYDTVAKTVTGTFTASGTEKSPSGASVSYSGTVAQLDMSSFNTATHQLYFVITPNTGPARLVWVNMDAEAADVSPVPLSSAATSGALALALVGAGAFMRRRLAR